MEFLKDLIQAESYNPPGNEKNVALQINNYLTDAGVKCEIFPFGENRANLIASLNDNFEGRNLLYNGHMDVVPPGNEKEWKYPPLSAYVKGSKARRKIFGRGTADMKGALAAMAISLKILKQLKFKPSGNLILNAVSDEETGGKVGTGWCLENHLEPINCDFTVIGETSYLPPLGRAIIVGEKGHLGIKIVTNGIQCHSSMPSLGKNAIEMMAEIMANINKMDNYMPVINPPMTLEKLKNHLSVVFPDKQQFEKVLSEQKVLNELIIALTNYTKNFTQIEAGIKENVIPDTCEANIDFRLLPGHTTEMIVQALTKMIEENIGYEVRDTPIGNPEDVFVYLDIGYESEASYWEEWEKSQILKDFATVAEKVYGHKLIYFLSPGGSDACFYRNNEYCKETIQFGPGRFSLVHATNEFIDLQDFKDAIKVYTLFAYNFLK
ncbi:MAG: M20 family metallopeptidase [Promethearchaeota archaeon]